ncbi:MAG: cob(I)yrinic acid a,c-diamide adenosyltransferase [Planctomycetota bacterium]
MKIYTKTGDLGETGLLGGIRIPKSHQAIEVNGALDEVNSWIGLARSEGLPEDIDSVLAEIQNDLFDLGSRVAASMGDGTQVPAFESDRNEKVENWIDQFDAENPDLRVFILPGGIRSASLIHVIRSICRRAERNLVQWINQGPNLTLNVELIYLNRLSDLLFVLGRLLNTRNQHPETEWKVGGTS